MNSIRIALIQMRSGADVARNVADASAMIRQAAGDAARVIATPEMTSFMDRRPGALREKAVDEASDPALAAFRALAAELSVTLLVGSLAIRVAKNKAANRSFLIGPDGVVKARYDKIHMFDVKLSETESYRESDGYAAGRSAVVAEAEGARIGMSVCYDVRFPRLYRELAQAGAEVLSVPAAFTETTGRAHWHVLLRARAIETGCFVIAPAQSGSHEDGRQTFGHSLVVNPWGEVIAERTEAEPGVLLVELDLSQVEAARRRVPSLSLDAEWTPPRV